MKNKGITLISLVITIIILIILASVAIYLSLGNNGIFIKSKEAKEKTNKQEATDIINLKITTAQMNKYAEKQEMPTLQELADVLYEDNEIQYVAIEHKEANKEKVTVGEKTSIFTKLNNYPYEFEINSKLQLASIDGIKVASNPSESNEKHKIETEYITDFITSKEWTKAAELKDLQEYSLFILSGYWDSEHQNKGCSTTFTLDEIKNCGIDSAGAAVLTGYITVNIYYNAEEEAIYMNSTGQYGYGRLMGIK